MALKSLVLLASFALALSLVLADSPIPKKRLAGPPEEFENHVVPNPQEVKITERSITLNVILTQAASKDEWTAELSVPVDGPQEFYFTFSSPYAEYIKLKLTDPRGAPVDLKAAEYKGSFPIGVGNTIPTVGYLVSNSQEGTYVLSVKAKDMPEHIIKKLEDSQFPHAVVILINNDNLMIESYLTSYVIATGKTVGVHAKIVNADGTAAVKSVNVAQATMDVESPNGADVKVPMNDQGVDGDVSANDGIYTGQMVITGSGQYVVKPTLSGYYDALGAEASTQFQRSAQHLVAVSPVQLDFTGKATVVKKDSERMIIMVGVSEVNPKDGLRAYTEVYGMKGSSLVPVAWLGGLVEIENGAISLELNSLWLQRAGVSGSLVLRNTYIADVSTSFPIATYFADIPVDNSATIPIPNFNKMLLKAPVAITKEMRQGVNPRLANRTTAVAGKKGLVLVPGYCATVSPWERNAADFTNAFFFDEMNLNVPNDEYAKKVIAFAEKKGLASFGLIGHSQGGVVATHIHNYYFSGLESATGGRLVQSVGTPYLGSTAAANAADLGSVFGVGCGSNSDLSRDGAANWLAGISLDTRKDVYYYTTTYKRNSFFGDYCSMPMNSILKWPNDGVTELQFASLKGGNDMGNADKECHTTDMAYPAQYDSKVRNKEMNAAAGR